MPPAKTVQEQTNDALGDIQAQYKADFALMDEVLDFVQRVVTTGSLKITRPRGLNEGIVTFVAGILTKACKTFRAIRATAAADCGQDASILLRALFEATIALVYILQKNTRTRSVLYAAHE